MKIAYILSISFFIARQIKVQIESNIVDETSSLLINLNRTHTAFSLLILTNQRMHDS